MGIDHSNIRAQAKPTVMEGQQECNHACRPCNGGGVTLNTQYEIFSFLREKSFFGAKMRREETQERAADLELVLAAAVKFFF